MVKSGANGIVNLFEPFSRLDITWTKKGEKKPLNLNQLQEAIWTEGVANLFRDGYLIIDEKDAHDIMVTLGLESEFEGAEQLINVLTEAQQKRLLTSAPFGEFKETVGNLGYEQIQLLAEYAIDNKCTDFDKCSLIKELVGTDVTKAIELRQKAKEA